MSRRTEDLAAIVRSHAGDAPVRVGLILGSGLGHLAMAVEGNAIAYDDLPGFPHAGVSGHRADLVVGDLEGQRVAVFGIGCPAFYRSPEALAVVAPRCFGFDFDYRPLEECSPH